jgi:hypothetical protein
LCITTNLAGQRLRWVDSVDKVPDERVEALY